MSTSAAKEEIVNKFNLLTSEHIKLVSKKAKIDASIDEIAKQIADCHAAARLFGFDLQSNPEIFPETLPEKIKPLIRDFVIAHLKSCNGIMPARAKDIQKSYEDEYHTKLHYKTVGMTLYRLKEEGLARREGRDWYLVDGTDLVI